MKIKALIVSLSLAIGGAAFAQTAPADPAATPGLDKRQARQQARIDQGVASGQLNAREANRLQKREAKLAADEQAAKADGVVTKRERVRLHREADRDSARIAKQKHDKQKANTPQ